MADICAYLDTYDIDGDERREWLQLIADMDQKWLDWALEKQEAEKDKDKKPDKRRP